MLSALGSTASSTARFSVVTAVLGALDSALTAWAAEKPSEHL